MIEPVYWIWMQQIFGIGTGRSDEVLSFVSSPMDVFGKSKTELEALHFFKPEEIHKITTTSLADAEADVKKAKKIGCKILTWDHPQYPERLRNIFSPPFLFYVAGELPDVDSTLSIAVVGTRKLSDYGYQATRHIVGTLAAVGTVIVSGFALGGDTAAHQEAVKHSGKTIGVLGCGIDHTYPYHNMELRKSVIKGYGAIISELPPGSDPNKVYFPIRNRIISGLSAGVLVIEAGVRSGTLLTAGHALSQDRDVFVVPGNIFHENCIGTNNLLKQGAIPVTCAADILAEYHIYQNYQLKKPEETLYLEQSVGGQRPSYISVARNFSLEGLTEEHKLVYLSLKEGEKDADELAIHLKLPIQKILPILTQLEIAGGIYSSPGRKFNIL